MSAAALTLSRGEPADQAVTSYIRPVTASALLAQQAETDPAQDTKKPVNEAFMVEMMDQLLHQRLAVDKEKSNEIEAMMEQVAQNENLSDEEKKIY